MLPSMLTQKLKAASSSAKTSSKKSTVATRTGKPTTKTTKKRPNATAATSSSIRKRSKPDHFKALTTDELNRLRETNDDLTNESLFAIQINEILQSAQPTEKYQNLSEAWINRLAEFIVTIPSDAAKRTQQSWTTSVMVPLDDLKFQTSNIEFQFLAVKQLYRIGSSQTGTILGPQYNFDVAVEIPASSFQKLDYLNMIYHRKKALYLARIASALAKWAEVASCEFSFFHADRFNPILRIRPSGLRKVTILLHVCCESNAFKLSRFLPSTSNVRATLFGKEGGEDLLATPHYNSSVLRDMTLLQNEEFFEKSIKTAPNVRDGLMLFKLWLRTRGLERISGFLVTAFAIWLLRKRKINLSMTVYEVVRNLWMNFGKFSWLHCSTGTFK